MKSLLPANRPFEPSTKTLDQLVSILATTVLPSAVRKKSFIVNDVPKKLFIAADKNMLPSVLSRIMHTVVSHAENSCIRIGADINGNIVMVNVKDNNSNNRSVTNELQQVQHIAQKMSGYISVSNKNDKNVSIAFSFPNLSKNS